MKLIKGSKNYYIDENGLIYRDKKYQIKPFVHTSKKELAKGKAKRFAVDLDIGRKMYHRVIAENLVDGYFEGAIVDHIDRNSENNHPSNLRWVTYPENRKNIDEDKRTKKIQSTWAKKKGVFRTPYGDYPTQAEFRRQIKIPYSRIKKNPEEYYYAR